MYCELRKALVPEVTLGEQLEKKEGLRAESTTRGLWRDLRETGSEVTGMGTKHSVLSSWI